MWLQFLPRIVAYKYNNTEIEEYVVTGLQEY